jgi:hypothetical protein
MQRIRDLMFKSLKIRILGQEISEAEEMLRHMVSQTEDITCKPPLVSAKYY